MIDTCAGILGGAYLLNDAIKLGPFLLRYHYLVIIISGIIAYLLMRHRLKSSPDTRETILNYAANSVFIWFVIWKFSYILFNFSKAISNPQTILFFSGGKNGALVGTAVALLYVAFTVKKTEVNHKMVIDTFIHGIISFLAVYYVALLFLMNEVFQNSIKLVVLVVIYLIYRRYRQKEHVHKKELSLQERKEIMKKIIVTIILVGLVGYTIYNAAFSEKTAAVGIEKGNVAPDFELVKLSGETIKLSDYKGKKVMLNFWASWCGPCRAEMPDMQELHEEGREDLVILAVNATHTEQSESGPANFVSEYGLTFPILIDEAGRVNETYQVIALPTTYFIDSEGKIADKFTGTLSYEQMLNGISKLN